MSVWPPDVARVGSFVHEAGGEARIEEMSGDVATAEAAADIVGCTLAEIVKSIVFLCDGAPVLAIVPGDRRVDPAAVARLAGTAQATIARSEEVVAATGFAPGGVAPFPPGEVRLVLIERTLLRHAVVWTGAGSARHLLRITPAELLRLAQGRVEEIVLPSA